MKIYLQNKTIILIFISLLTIGGIFGVFYAKAHAAGDTFYVNIDTGDDGYDGTSATFLGGSVGPTRTITRAIALASSGDTIQVAPTTYDDIGDITINKSVKIESQAGTWNASRVTKISGNSTFVVGTDDIEIVGFSFDNTTNTSVEDTGAFDNVIVRNCKFRNIEDTPIYISDGTNWLISNNYFMEIGTGGVGPSTGIVEDSMTNLQISENVFINVRGNGITDTDGTNLTIDNNSFYKVNFYGISLSGTAGAHIYGNELENADYLAGGAAIYLLADTLTTGSIIITGNTITNTSGTGIGTAIGTTATNFGGAVVMITGNNLAGNTWGIDYAGTGTVYAQSNWWGSSTGPYHASDNPHGLGSAITDNAGIEFAPYDTVDYWVSSYSAVGNSAMVAFKDKLYQARRDANNHLYTRYSNNGHSWSGWSYGGHAYSDIAMAVNGSALYQAMKGTGGYFYRRYTTNGTTWSNWAKSGTTIGKINMWSYGGDLYQTKVTSGNKAYMRFNNNSWSYIGTSLSNVESVNFGPGIIQARIAATKYIYYRTSIDGISWSPWFKEGGSAKSITLAVFNDVGSVFMTKVGLDNSFYSRIWGGAWTKYGSAIGKPSMVELDDRLYQAKRLSNNNIYLRYSFDGITWSAWQIDHSATSDETITAFSDELFRCLRGTNGKIYSTHF